jgi:hypothetical protein
MVSSTLLDRLPRLIEEKLTRSQRRATAKNKKTSLEAMEEAVVQKEAKSLSRMSRRSNTLHTLKIQRRRSLRRDATNATGTRSRRGARNWPGVGCSDLG